jgi:hypothetical protein
MPPMWWIQIVMDAFQAAGDERSHNGNSANRTAPRKDGSLRALKWMVAALIIANTHL